MAPAERKDSEPSAKDPAAGSDGWDDGRGRRPQSSRPGRAERRKRAKATAADKDQPKTGGGVAGFLRGLPVWVLPAVLVIVLLLATVTLVFGGGGDDQPPGACLVDLAERLPESDAIQGTDLAAARDAGYDDGGDLEKLGSSQRETGALPDALTLQYRYGRLVTAEDFTGLTGVDASKIGCSLGSPELTVMSGEFEPAEIEGTVAANDGRLVATEDIVGFSLGEADPSDVLEPLSDGGLGADENVVAVLEALQDGGSYSVLVQVGSPGAERSARAAGIGVAEADDSDDRALVVAWSYSSRDAANAGRSDVVDRVNATLQGVTSITAEDLTVDGTVVTAKIETRRAPDLLRLTDPLVELLPSQN